jgi:hypothetical protein
VKKVRRDPGKVIPIKSSGTILGGAMVRSLEVLRGWKARSGWEFRGLFYGNTRILVASRERDVGIPSGPRLVREELL